MLSTAHPTGADEETQPRDEIGNISMKASGEGPGGSKWNMDKNQTSVVGPLTSRLVD